LSEYPRSAKVLKFHEQAGVSAGGSVLDGGYGGCGMPPSCAEEARQVVGIGLAPRSGDIGHALAAEGSVATLHVARADGQALSVSDACFDMEQSHAVIEHVADAALDMHELARVLKPGGTMDLSTAPHLSFAGAHLPELVVPIPLHLLLGRRLSFGIVVWLARHAPWALQEPEHENSFIKLARQGRPKHDDLLEKVRIPGLRGHSRQAGLTVVSEALQVTGTLRRAPAAVVRWLRETPLVQDIVVGNVEYVLVRDRKG
jgi:SAM-dependent methyltransferase